LTYGYYAGCAPRTGDDAIPVWLGATLRRTLDFLGYTTLDFFGSQNGITKYGYALTALSAPANFTNWDNTNSVTIAMEYGGLSSASEADVLLKNNVGVLGQEIFAFTTVVDNGNNTYTLSGLLRGLRGSNTLATHVAGETFVLLDNSNIKRMSSPTTDIGVEMYYQAATKGSVRQLESAVAFTNTGAGLAPYSPVHVTAALDGSSNLDISWVRRNRILNDWANGSDVPLSETSELYIVVNVEADKQLGHFGMRKLPSRY